MPGPPSHPPQALFENLVESAPDALLVVDASGCIVLVNRTAEALFGFDRRELLGAPIEQLIPGRLHRTHIEHRAAFAANPRTREMGAKVGDLLALRKDGSEFPVEVRLSPLDGQAQPLVAAAVRDVTDRRHAANVLHAAQVQADGANAAKSRLLATASHDLRQPLQALQLLNAALLEQVDAPEPRQLLLHQQDALQSMAGLLNSLLDISKLEAGAMTPVLESVNVAQVLEALRHEFESLARARGLRLEVSGDPHYIRTDRTLFRQLLQNLLANAVKFTEAGSVRLSSFPENGGLRIEVADTGVGIPPEHIGRIFEDYYQVRRRSGEGSGLGLSIVKRIAALLDLSLDVRSEPGKGTTFLVRIPASQLASMAPVPALAKSHARGAAAPGALILLVEDDDSVRAATAFYLKAVGHRPIAVPGIAAAERALQEAQRTPDLLISDYHLSAHETGIQAIQRLRDRMGREVPALLLSGDTSLAVRELAQSGTCRILSKPVDVDDLLEAICELLPAAAPQPLP